MTLLNTLCNLGGNWPSTIVLWLVDVLTWRKCDLDDANLCSNKSEKEVTLTLRSTLSLKIFYSNKLLNLLQLCSSTGGKCTISIDGYYLECGICLVYALLWYYWGKSKIKALQNLPARAWNVVSPKHKEHIR